MSYHTVLADPPWLERGSGKIKRGADKHYPLLKTGEIPGVMMQSGVWGIRRDAHLYLWVTNNKLPDGLWVMGDLSFRYITQITWAKRRIGLGKYRRGQTEHILLGVRGKAMVPDDRTFSTLLGKDILSPPGRVHSRKPERQYVEIEATSPGPYLEMFATKPRPGWDSWGTLRGPGTDPVLIQTTKRGISTCRTLKTGSLGEHQLHLF